LLSVIIYLTVTPSTPSIPLPSTPSIPLPGAPSIPLPGAPSIPLPGAPSIPLPEVFTTVYLNSLPEVCTIKAYSYLLSLLRSNLSDSNNDQQFLADILQALRTGVLEEPVVDAV